MVFSLVCGSQVVCCAWELDCLVQGAVNGQLQPKFLVVESFYLGGFDACATICVLVSSG